MNTPKRTASHQRTFTGVAAKGLPRWRQYLAAYQYRRWHLWVVGVVLAGLLAWWIKAMFLPPQGNALYGLCRAYIERQVPFPLTLEILGFNQIIPAKEDPRNPQSIELILTVSYTDGFGQNIVQDVGCLFRFDQKLVGTPWQGIVLSQVTVNGKFEHGWADVYIPDGAPGKSRDTNNRLEDFYIVSPSLLVAPPDLTLPQPDINRLPIERYKDL